MTSRQLARFFAPVVRTRGARYVQERAVRQMQTRDGVLRAVVSASDVHSVELEVADGRLRGACTCVFARDHDVCKHLWATILAAEENGSLSALRPEEPGTPSRVPVFGRERAAGWRTLLEVAEPPPVVAAPGCLLCVLDLPRIRETEQLHVDLLLRTPWGPQEHRPITLDAASSASLPGTIDRALVALLREVGRNARPGWADLPDSWLTPVTLPDTDAPLILSLAGRAGALRLRLAVDGEVSACAFDEGPAWALGLTVDAPEGDGGPLHLRGVLRRGEDTAALAAPLVLTNGGWVVFPDAVARLDHRGLFQLVARLRAEERLVVPWQEAEALVTRLYALPSRPRLDLPEALSLVERTVPPRVALSLTAPRSPSSPDTAMVTAQLSFTYEDETVLADDPRGALVRFDRREALVRDRPAEQAARARLHALGFRSDAETGLLQIAPSRVPPTVRALVSAGWRVEADGKVYRSAGRFDLSISSGIDWFDLQATLAFDDMPVPLPALLAAARGDGVVALGDGSFGVLPEDWMARHRLLVTVGEQTPEGALRFRRGHAPLLDLLLAAEPDVHIDEAFAHARRELAGFDRVAPVPAPADFVGSLRPYQALGVGWMAFLRRFGFGGCLADDMGLGKTIQVLAMLGGRRLETGRPSLIVVPKSLVSNWVAEAARFTPSLHVLPHVGPGRATSAAAFDECDVVLTTYGTLKNDVRLLGSATFDYVILDEAQAIKNAASLSAKAARLLSAQHRLALSGTPVENHLGELWSLFEFLNPGFVGRLGVESRRSPQLEPFELETMARALRPFILRRTKAQVAADLPAKHEEILVCDMQPAQRRLYDEMRAHFRRKVLSEIDRGGVAGARMHVLEALLRLRQAACHPGLIDRQRGDEPSAKLDVLLPRLGEIVAEGHKALVFSQFTSLLALVRPRLTAAGIDHEYLDGKTVDRAARVARFQEDPGCGVFLLSLKAGGLGLNLTAADYVFILDPWWNPAVEAQAIDRAHRIGQKRCVFAYRLLCRDTVEEKIAQLQESKRGLAEAIVTADESFFRRLDRQTLEQLLS